MKLVIIRHGDPNYEKDCLNELGVQQAEALSKYLKDEHFVKVYSSPLGRAYETACACFDKDQIEVVDWLREFNHDVILTDGTQQLNWDFYPEYFAANPDFCNQEKYLDTPEMKSADMRKWCGIVGNELDKILAANGYERSGRCYKAVRPNRDKIVMFCHFGVMSVLMAHLMNIPYLVLAQHLCASPTSITTFATEERHEGWAHFRCLAFGETPHLAKVGMDPSFSARFCETFDSDERH